MMQFKQILGLCVLSCSFAAFTACSDDSSSSGPSSSGSEIPSSSNSGGGEVPTPGSSAGSTVFGSLPANADLAVTANLYNVWKTNHYTTLQDEQAKYPEYGAEFGEIFAPYGNAARIIWSTYTGYKGCTITEAKGTTMYRRGCTVSEGIGYGMLITLFQEDYEAYNLLWNYAKAFRNTPYASGSGLMPWLTASFTWEIGDDASATDADLDIATSLVLAYYKTGIQDYLADALTLINAIWNQEINPANLYIYSGDTPSWKTADPAYNLSYFSPVALRLFAQVDPAHDWNGVLTNMYAYMQQVQAGGTGVFPDWSNTQGVAVDPKNNSATKTYWLFDKESVRIPWRIAWDYYWFGDERAAQVLNTLNTFIVGKSAGDPSAIPSVNYSWNLAVGADKEGATLPTHWLGAWCLTGMAGNPDWVTNCTALLNAKTMAPSASSYFIDILHMMYSQLLNGAYKKPF